MRLLVGFALLAATSAYGQMVISAHSGVIQLVEGRAYLDDKTVAPKFGQFPDIKQDQVFRTEEGRAEVLLTPGVFLRMGEDSSVRMVSNRLTDTRLEVLGGSVMLECDEIPKDNAILLMYKGDTIMLVKHGLYRLDTRPSAVLQVFDGEAVVKSDSGQLTLKSGKQTALGAALMAEHFDRNSTDELYRWSSRRASYLAKANVSSAMSLRSTGGLGGGFGGWQFNPLFGLFTFVPYNGIGYSPFGYGWWSPYTVIYYAPYGNGVFNGGGGGGYSPNRTLLGSGNSVFSAADNGRAFSPSAGPSFSRGGAVSSGGAMAPISQGGGGAVSGGAAGGGGSRAGGHR